MEIEVKPEDNTHIWLNSVGSSPAEGALAIRYTFTSSTAVPWLISGATTWVSVQGWLSTRRDSPSTFHRGDGVQLSAETCTGSACSLIYGGADRAKARRQLTTHGLTQYVWVFILKEGRRLILSRGNTYCFWAPSLENCYLALHTRPPTCKTSMKQYAFWRSGPALSPLRLGGRATICINRSVRAVYVQWLSIGFSWMGYLSTVVPNVSCWTLVRHYPIRVMGRWRMYNIGMTNVNKARNLVVRSINCESDWG